MDEGENRTHDEGIIMHDDDDDDDDDLLHSDKQKQH